MCGLNQFTMQNIQEQGCELYQLADEIIANPTQPLLNAAEALRLSPSVLSFIRSGSFVAGMLSLNPMGMLAAYLWHRYTDSQKARLEKERMLREVIAKQQAVISKLDVELAKQRKEGAQNRAEIEHLKELLLLLEKFEAKVQEEA